MNTKPEMTNKNVIDVYPHRFPEFCIQLAEPMYYPVTLKPEELFTKLLEDTGLTEGDFATCIPLFGHQIWILREGAGKDELFKSHKQKTFAPRILKFMQEGLIREGHW